MPTLVDVRTGVHEGFDRVVFEFVGGLPDYDIEWVEPPILRDPSGLPIDVSGASFLQVRLSLAAAHDDAGETTVSVSDLKPDLSGIVEVTQVGDFEGVVTWVLGLTPELDYEVSELESPSRLVIDVKHL